MNAQIMTNSGVEKHLSAADTQAKSLDETMPRPLANLIFVLLILILCSVGSWRLLDPATLPIKHVRIEGNFQHLSPQRMQSMVSTVIKGGFFNLNVMGIKEALLSEPWVNWVVVQRVWPDGLRVYIKEHTAVAHWNTDDLLNESAQLFSPETARSINGIPYLSGPTNTQALVFRRYREIKKVVQPVATVKSLSLSERRAWQLQLHDGPLVILGRNDVDSRIDRFTGSVLTSLSDELIRVKQIDLRYTNGFAIQWLDNFQKSIESGLEINE